MYIYTGNVFELQKDMYIPIHIYRQRIHTYIGNASPMYTHKQRI